MLDKVHHKISSFGSFISRNKGYFGLGAASVLCVLALHDQDDSPKLAENITAAAVPLIFTALGKGTYKAIEACKGCRRPSVK